MLTIALAPALEPVALTKTSIKGNPVAELSAFSSSPRQKSVAVTMAKPREPFRATEASILLGITVDASSISSAKDHGSQDYGKTACSRHGLLTHVSCCVDSCELLAAIGKLLILKI